MLPKKERLSREEFNRFFSMGKRSHSPSFQCIYAPFSSLHASVVVSKKIAGKAVDRNRIRRRIYDIVRHYRSDTQLKGVFIFVAKPDVRKISYQSLKEEIYSHLQKLISK